VRPRLVPVLTAALLALLAAAGLALSPPVHRMEDRALDSRFALRGDQPVTGLAVVAIDERTVSAAGRTWPLRRRLHARVLDRLRAAGAAQVVYDVQFTEPSAFPRDDLALYDAAGRAGHVVFATGESDDRGRTSVLGGDDALAAIGATAAAAGFATGPGGVIREYEQRVGHLPTIAATTARLLGHPAGSAGLEDGRALIDYRGPAGTIPAYSFDAVLDGRVAAADLRGRTVVVGASAPVLQDLHPTSAGGRLMPGPEIQANAIWTALHGNPLRRLPGWTAVLLIALGGLLGPLAVLLLGALRGAGAAVTAGVLAATAAQLAFNRGIVAPVAAPLLALALGTAASVLAAVTAETAERRRVDRRNAELEDAVLARTRELEDAYLDVVRRLARAAELRDDDTGEHIERVGRLCELVALELGLPAARAQLLRQASVLHDVGKIGLPDQILRKPGRLTPEEIEVMRRHTLQGAELLKGSDSGLLQLAEVVARTHHERFDGTGYPLGTRGEDIPLEGRITAVCDVYDALVSERPYKHAWSPEDASAEIAAQRGRHFDPRVADALLAVLGRPAAVAAPAAPPAA
jgi:response regulator RpfG family c-di-GMP phosphodiesterase